MPTEIPSIPEQIQLENRKNEIKEVSWIYPNPTKDFFRLINPAIENLELYNIAGKLEKQWDNATVDQQYSTSQLQEGIYYLRLNTRSGEFKTEKLIIIK